MAFNSSAAAAYLGSPMVVGPVSGYRDVQSNVFAEALGTIPLRDQQAALDFGAISLAQAGENKRQQSLLDYNKWVNEQQLKQDRRAGLRLAGAGLMQALSSGFQLPALSDPRQMQIDQMNFNRARQQDRNARMLGTSATTASILRGLA